VVGYVKASRPQAEAGATHSGFRVDPPEPDAANSVCCRVQNVELVNASKPVLAA